MRAPLVLALLLAVPTVLAAPPAAEPARPDLEAAALGRAGAAATRLATTLKGRVLEEMGKGGPASAVRVCAEEAPAIAAKIEAETGVRVGRGSLRLRNPANAAPGWVQAWLTAQGERPAEGVQGVSTIAEGQARLLKPIAIEAPCLACHGAPETLAPDVKAALAELRPDDRATGYALGDLRGALWAEAPVK